MVDQITIDCFHIQPEESLKLINESWSKIPLVNEVDYNNLQNGNLVRFTGMVQDMHGPEYYVEKYEMEDESGMKKTVSGKYKELVEIKEPEVFTKENTGQRQTFVVISIPGLNSWTQTTEKNLKPTEANENTSCKRKLDDEEMEVETSENNKRSCSNESSTSASQTTTSLSPSFLLNCPLPDRPGKVCLVKLYDNYDWIKLNEMIEICGFLTIDPAIAACAAASSSGDEMDMETQVMNPPTSLIPRIHAVHAIKVSHNNPLLPITLNNAVGKEYENVYKDLHLVLTQILLGDKLAAEFLICHLISRIYLRQSLTAIGQFSLNLSNVPVSIHPEYAKKVYEILELLLPKSHYFEMTLENMNTLDFVPKKDYDCNRLSSGLLQLSANTHLVVDETRLQNGRLDQMGVLNIQELSNVIKDQRIHYDFKFYRMDYETDIPVLIFSEGRSLLPSDFHVPIVSDSECLNTLNEIIAAAKHFLNPDLLNKIRKYLTETTFATCELSDEMQTVVQDDFVKMRQDDTTVNADDLHRLLILARLVTLAHGGAVVGIESWNKAREMENQRRQRMKKDT